MYCDISWAVYYTVPAFKILVLPCVIALVLWQCPGSTGRELAEWQGSPEAPVISRHTLPPATVCVDSGGSTLCSSASNLWVDSELSAASLANAKTNLVIISGNPAHYRLLNYPINSTSWESLFATQANVCSQISWQEDSSIVQTQGFDNAEQTGLKTEWQRNSDRCSTLCTLIL